MLRGAVYPYERDDVPMGEETVRMPFPMESLDRM